MSIFQRLLTMVPRHMMKLNCLVKQQAMPRLLYMQTPKHSSDGSIFIHSFLLFWNSLAPVWSPTRKYPCAVICSVLAKLQYINKSTDNNYINKITGIRKLSNPTTTHGVATTILPHYTLQLFQVLLVMWHPDRNQQKWGVWWPTTIHGDNYFYNFDFQVLWSPWNNIQFFYWST